MVRDAFLIAKLTRNFNFDPVFLQSSSNFNFDLFDILLDLGVFCTLTIIASLFEMRGV